MLVLLGKTYYVCIVRGTLYWLEGVDYTYAELLYPLCYIFSKPHTNTKSILSCTKCTAVSHHTERRLLRRRRVKESRASHCTIMGGFPEQVHHSCSLSKVALRVCEHSQNIWHNGEGRGGDAYRRNTVQGGVGGWALCTAGSSSDKGPGTKPAPAVEREAMSNRSRRTVVAEAEPTFVQSCSTKWSKGLQRGARWDKVCAYTSPPLCVLLLRR